MIVRVPSATVRRLPVASYVLVVVTPSAVRVRSRPAPSYVQRMNGPGNVRSVWRVRRHTTGTRARTLSITWQRRSPITSLLLRAQETSPEDRASYPDH